jgi:hypothetical protein
VARSTLIGARPIDRPSYSRILCSDARRCVAFSVGRGDVLVGRSERILRFEAGEDEDVLHTAGWQPPPRGERILRLIHWMYKGEYMRVSVNPAYFERC